MRLVQTGGKPVPFTASGQVVNAAGGTPSSGVLLGVFVVSSASGTLAVYDDSATGTAVNILPATALTAATYYPMGFTFSQGLNLVVGGTLSAVAVIASQYGAP